MSEDIDKGSWAVLELFGHKVVSGYMTVTQEFGVPMVRVDIPSTGACSLFTRIYNPSAIYSISYVSEDVAKLTAEAVAIDPVVVYIPELSELKRLKEENDGLRENFLKMKSLLRPNNPIQKDDIPF